MHSLCCSTLLWLKYMKKFIQIWNGKMEEYLRAFLDNRVYSLITHQNLTSSNFLKFSRNEQSNTAFLYCFALKSFGLLCILNESFSQVWFCDMLYWLHGKYSFTELWRLSKCWHILHNIENSLILALIQYSQWLEMFLKIGKLSNSWWQIHVYQNSNFH